MVQIGDLPANGLTNNSKFLELPTQLCCFPKNKTGLDNFQGLCREVRHCLKVLKVLMIKT
jgi:hypothetical protein